jgi:hypothetical protein
MDINRAFISTHGYATPKFTEEFTGAFRLEASKIRYAKKKQRAKRLRELERLNFQLLCPCFKLAFILCT